MNRFKLLISILLFFVTIQQSNAQKSIRGFKFLSGDEDLSFLKDELVVNIKFEYKFNDTSKSPNVRDVYEQKFIKEVKERLNNSESGKGDRWAITWKTDRKSMLEPEFKENISKELAERNCRIKATNKEGFQKYTITVRTCVMDPGWDAGVIRSNPVCTYLVYWQETFTGKILAQVSFSAMDWNGCLGNYEDHTLRLKILYGFAGQEIGKFMSKKLK